MKAFRCIYITAAAFAVSHACVSTSGFFSTVRPDAWTVLYSMPLYLASFVVLVSMAIEVAFRRGRAGAARWLAFASACLLCAGFWLGGLKGYSIRVVITEGQTVQLPAEAASGLGGYIGKYANVAGIAATLINLDARLNPEGDRLMGLSARMQVSVGGADAVEMTANNSPSINPFGVSFGVSEFGYSPRFELYAEDGSLLDSSFVFLNLFPPGEEDYFRLLSPLTYYLRYDPRQGDGRVLKVRVARNRDIAYSGSVALGERFLYENAGMSFAEVRKWTVLEVRSNPGAPFLWAGAVASLAALLQVYRRRIAACKAVVILI